MRVGVLTLALAAAATLALAQPLPLPPAVLTGGVQPYSVVHGDTLASIGARFGVDTRTLAADNALAVGGRLAVGQTLVVDNRHLVPAAGADAALVINIPQRLLFHRADPLTAWPIAVGRRDWPTPVGQFTVVALERHPTWDVPASIAAEARRQGRELPKSVPPGPNNPLGDFWIGLSGGGIGVHGTNAPGSIYGAVTHGCIRLHPDDIATLFPRVTVGAAVAIVYEPVLVADVGGRIFLEVHPDVYRKGRLIERVRVIAAAQGLDDRVDWQAAAAVVAARHGVARDVSARDLTP